jgi:hypothetical protein
MDKKTLTIDQVRQYLIGLSAFPKQPETALFVEVYIVALEDYLEYVKQVNKRKQKIRDIQSSLNRYTRMIESYIDSDIKYTAKTSAKLIALVESFKSKQKSFNVAIRQLVIYKRYHKEVADYLLDNQNTALRIIGINPCKIIKFIHSVNIVSDKDD